MGRIRRLRDLPAGSLVFVDASVMAPYFARTDALGQACAAFLERVAGAKFRALTSIPMVMEVVHRVMVAEAMTRFNKGPREIVTYLKKHPQAVRTVKQHLGVPATIYQMGISIEPPTRIEMYSSRAVRAEYGLMANDSLLAAMMRKRHIIHLATNDADFKRVPWIQMWRPRV